MSFALALPVALPAAPAFALALPVALAATPAFALTLPDTHALVHAHTAICLLASLLAGGAFRVGLRRAAVAISAAALATLRQRGACGQ